MIKIYVSAAIVGVISMVGAAWLLMIDRGDALSACLAPGVIRGSEAFGGPFLLINQHGQTVTERDVITKPTLIYFGYTFCPDVCPFDAARNAAAVDLLKAKGYDVQSAFVSIDPVRDTVEEIAGYTEYMHPEMVGLTGSLDQVETAAKAYRVVYSKSDDRGDGFYLMNHSTFTYLAVPDRGVLGIFPKASDTTSQLGSLSAGMTEEVVATATACLLDAV